MYLFQTIAMNVRGCVHNGIEYWILEVLSQCPSHCMNLHGLCCRRATLNWWIRFVAVVVFETEFPVFQTSFEFAIYPRIPLNLKAYITLFFFMQCRGFNPGLLAC